MSAGQDVGLYGSPPVGVDLTSYWTSPRWWFPLGPQPECPVSSRTCPGATGREVTAGRGATPIRGTARLLASVSAFFNRQRHRTLSITDDADPAVPAVCDITPEDGVDDLTLALMTLFAEDCGESNACMSGYHGDCNSDVDQLGRCEHLMSVCHGKRKSDDNQFSTAERLMTNHHDDGGVDGDKSDPSECHQVSGYHDNSNSDCNKLRPCMCLTSANHDDSNRHHDVTPSAGSRKVTFADDAGLPLTVVLTFDMIETPPGDAPSGDAAARHELRRNYRLTKRKARLGAQARGEERTGYRRYYKPYVEDYESCRVQAAGAFSMVGF